MVSHGPGTNEKLYEVGKRKAADEDDDWDTWGDWRANRQSTGSGTASSGSGIVPKPPSPPRRQPRQPAEPPSQHRIAHAAVPPTPDIPRDDEEWSTVEIPFDSRKWREVLDYHGVDNEAQHALFLFCQHSPKGARAANSLLARFVKAVANQRDIKNPSAFINSGAMRARHLVEDMYGQGKDTWRS